MLKAEQMPKEAITKMMKSVHWSSFYGEDDARELIAAALNAWPGMSTGPNIYGRRDAVMHLPLPQEPTND